MKFGTEITQIPFGTSSPNLWRATFERCELLEELGFHFGTLGQHRFEEGWPSTPWTVLAAVAARTSKLRIGSGVLILPSHHPLEVAEQVATVDELSGGRVFLGVGAGYRRFEFDAVQVPFETRGARMDEGLEILRRVWTENHVSYHGAHYAFEDISVFPKPVQRPHPPLWVGANLRRGFKRAGTLGDGWYGGTMDYLPHLVPLLDYYRSVAAENGRQPFVCLKRPLAIATREELEETWLPGALSFRKLLAQSGGRWLEDPAFYERLRAGSNISYDEFIVDRAIVGSAENCIEQLRRAHALTGCEYVHVALNELRGSPEMHVNQLRRFAKEVMPAFAD